MPFALRAVMEETTRTAADWPGALHTELTRNPRGCLTPAPEHGAAATFSPTHQDVQMSDQRYDDTGGPATRSASELAGTGRPRRRVT